MQRDYGLLLPLIEKKGFSAFNLEIFVMPEDSILYSHLFLEQCHILTGNYKLNTQTVVNFRVDQGITIYLYDSKGEILYNTTTSLNELKDNLSIHH